MSNEKIKETLGTLGKDDLKYSPMDDPDTKEQTAELEKSLLDEDNQDFLKVS